MDVHEFWEKQAEEHGSSDLATAPDHFYRELEIGKIIATMEVIPNASVLDVGCGNGYSTMKFAERFPGSFFVGIDFSKKMIKEAQKAAKKAKIKNVLFVEGDVQTLSTNSAISDESFDIVLSERCLINLPNWPEQELAILEMRKMLAPNGHLILVENTQDGLANLNSVRQKFGLPEIKVRWHNHYLPDDQFTQFSNKINGALMTMRHVENIGNMYYLMSRVLYAKMCADEGKEPEYGHKINEIAAQMPVMGEHYACSPNFMFVFQNIDDGRSKPRWGTKKLSS